MYELNVRAKTLALPPRGWQNWVPGRPFYVYIFLESSGLSRASCPAHRQHEPSTWAVNKTSHALQLFETASFPFFLPSRRLHYRPSISMILLPFCNSAKFHSVLRMLACDASLYCVFLTVFRIMRLNIGKTRQYCVLILSP